MYYIEYTQYRHYNGNDNHSSKRNGFLAIPRTNITKADARNIYDSSCKVNGFFSTVRFSRLIKCISTKNLIKRQFISVFVFQ